LVRAATNWVSAAPEPENIPMKVPASPVTRPGVAGLFPTRARAMLATTRPRPKAVIIPERRVK
jgi:hypothetical protein